MIRDHDEPGVERDDCYWVDDEDDDFDWYEHTDGAPRVDTVPAPVGSPR